MRLQVLGVDLEDALERGNGLLVLALQKQDAPDLVQDHAVARVHRLGGPQRFQRKVVVAVGLLDHGLKEMDAPELGIDH